MILAPLTLVAVLAMPSGPMTDSLSLYIRARENEFESIPAERKKELAALVEYVRDCRKAGRPIRLTFICTHNSRRSHLSQIWASTAAAHYGVENVRTFSGGTEATAFNHRAVAALRRAGFLVSEPLEVNNPKFQVRWHAAAEPMICYSKKYNEAPNPGTDFAAVMTCTQADRACPIVQGAAARITLPFDDPKAADGTSDEERVYDERTAQIGREMLFVFSGGEEKAPVGAPPDLSRLPN